MSVDQPAQTTVEIDLGGTAYILKPTLSAKKGINRLVGGYAPLFRQLQAYDVDAFVGVIAAGTGTTGTGLKTLERRVYEADIAELLKPIVRFVNICAAGGRDLEGTKAVDEADETGSEEQQPASENVAKNLDQIQRDAKQFSEGSAIPADMTA